MVKLECEGKPDTDKSLMGNVDKGILETLGVVGDGMVGSSSDVKRGDLRKVGLVRDPQKSEAV